MKKSMICMLLSIVLIAGKAHAIDYSFGWTFGASLDNFRGDDLPSSSDAWDPFATMSMSLIDVFIEFTPFFALETGIGLMMGDKTFYDDSYVIDLDRTGITIPLMARVQTSFGESRFSTDKNYPILYAATGPKISIPFFQYYTNTRYVNYSGPKNNPITIDISFAAGMEFKLTRYALLGYRLHYDLNLISPLPNLDWYHDSFGFSLTFRVLR